VEPDNFAAAMLDLMSRQRLDLTSEHKTEKKT